MSQNMQLGGFVLTGLILFIVAIFYIGSEHNIFNRTFTIAAVFKNVEGLKSGDNVWLSGVKIGTVENVSIMSEGRVLVTLLLKDKQSEHIRRDATATIGSDGLVGNKIVVIRSGTSSAVIQDHDTINAYSPADTQDLLNIAKEVGENTRSLTSDLKTIAEKINKGEGVVGELLNDGELAQEIRQTVARLNQTGSNTAHATAELNSLFADAHHGDGLLPTLIEDTTYAQTFAMVLENIQDVSKQSAEVATNLRQVVQKMNENENALGVIMSDTTFANNLKHTIENADHAAFRMEEVMEAMQHSFLFRGYFRRKYADK